jgi:peptide/nickel transport system substrate-binding protein
VSEDGAEAVERRPRIAALWQKHRARWTLPLVIIVIIAAVAIVDHIDSHRISQVDGQDAPSLIPASGGGTTVVLDQPWDGFNPNTPGGAASTSPTLLASVLPSAYEINPKLAPQVNSALLSSVEVTSASPLTIQYQINPAAVWSDGVPVTAEDFIYAWESQRGDGVDVNGQPDQVASSLGYRDVSSVESGNGGKTATVVFNKPFTDWRVMFSNMVPAHIAERVGWNQGFATFNPAVDLSAGPMVVQSVSSKVQAILIRNPKWWGTPSLLDKVTVNVAKSQKAWTGTMAVGDENVANLTSFDLSSLEAVSSFPNAQSSVNPSLDFLELDFNAESPLMSQTSARQAIAHAVSRNDLLNETFGAIDPTLMVDQDHLTVPTQAGYVESSAAGEYSLQDLAATDRLLRSIGYHKDPTGLYVDADGRPLTLRMVVESGDPWIHQVATEMVAELHVVGIGVVASYVDGSQGLQAAVAANSYDMALVTRTASPFETTTSTWYSDGLGLQESAGTQNWSRTSDPQVDQLFLEAAQELNPVVGGTIYGQIDDQLWDQMVALPLFQEPVLVANGVQIANVEYNASTDGILWNSAFWSLLKPRPVKH